jgi:CheY-like chemotaxis protein
LISKSTPKNILIVEDDGIQQIIMKRLADRLGLNIVGLVRTGIEAVRAAQSHKNLDLIMMDVRLADDIDGIEAMSRIREISDSVKVIYVTGNTEDETRIRAVATRYEAFLEKPITEDDLKAAVSDAFAAA